MTLCEARRTERRTLVSANQIATLLSHVTPVPSCRALVFVYTKMDAKPECGAPHLRFHGLELAVGLHPPHHFHNLPLPPRLSHWYQVILLADRGHGCAKGCYTTAWRPGLELTTIESQVDADRPISPQRAFIGFKAKCTVTITPIACGSVLLRRRCDTLCTSGFVDDVMFSHSRSMARCMYS